MMKKHVLLGTVLFAAISAFSQADQNNPKTTKKITARLSEKSSIFNEPNTGANLSAAPSQLTPTKEPYQFGAKTSVVNDWTDFTGSMNAYGVSIGGTKPLQWNDELNAVTFVHRKSTTYSFLPAPASVALSGAIVSMVSSDCGGTWDSTALYSNDTYWGRFPGGAIYNPPSTPTNTNISNAYIVGAGPTVGSTSFNGNWYASKQLGPASYDNIASSAVGAQQYMPAAGPYTSNLKRHDFAAYDFTATDDGKMRVIAGSYDPNLGTSIDTGVVLVTGTFNNGVFDWAGTYFHPPVTNKTIGATNPLAPNISDFMTAWNESGTHGYVVIMGSRLNATLSNVGYQPIVYKTTNSGTTWSLEPPIDFNSPTYADVKRPIRTVKTNDTLEVPYFWGNEGMDVTVDKNNKLHIFATITGHYSNDVDSMGYYSTLQPEGYIWNHIPGFRPYLYDFIYDGSNSTWSHITVDSLSSECPGRATTQGGYQENPWDGDPASSNQKLASGARLQMSRTPDGEYIVYTWAESDSTETTQQKKWNSLPYVKARVMNVTTGQIHPLELNVTKYKNGVSGIGGVVAARSTFHMTSPKCRIASLRKANGPVISLPMTVTNSTPYSQLTSNTHWFSWVLLNFGNVPDNRIDKCGALKDTVIDTTSVLEIALNSATSSYLFPNPTKNNATLNINLEHSSKVKIEVTNAMGQVLKSSTSEGVIGENNINIELSGLATGIYLVKVKIDNAISTKKLIIE